MLGSLAVPKDSLGHGELSEAEKKSPSLKKLRDLKEKVLRELEEGQTEAAAATTLQDDRHKEKAAQMLKDRKIPKEVEPQAAALEAERAKLFKENREKRELIQLRQETAVRREEQCQTEIATLKRRLDSVVIAQSDALDGQLMTRLRAVNSQIQSEAQQLKGIIEKQAEAEKMNVVRTFRVKMHEVKKNLTDEKEKNLMGVQEWIEKKKSLESDLETATKDMNQLMERNKSLVEENKGLKVAYRKQEAERQAMVKNIAIVKKENERLESQVRKQEQQALLIAGGGDTDGTHQGRRGSRRDQGAGDPHTATATATAGGSRSSSAQGSHRGSTPGGYQPAAAGSARSVVRGRKHEGDSRNGAASPASSVHVINVTNQSTINPNISTSLSGPGKYAQQLKEVRRETLGIMSERTQLRLFLQQCLDDVRKEISRNSRFLQSRPVSAKDNADMAPDHYSSADRKKVLEILLSKERVLSLLFTRTFPEGAPNPVPTN